MKTSNTSVLKIYASITDKIQSEPIAQYILLKAKKEKISGATVVKGIMGYGMSTLISSPRFWELTEKLPVIIELIDYTDKLEKFYKIIEKKLLAMKKGCMVVMEPIDIKLIKKGR